MNKRIFDGALSFVLTQLGQKLLAKNSIALRSRHLEFFNPCDVIFHLT